MEVSIASVALAAVLLTGSASHEAVRPAPPISRVSVNAIPFTDGILTFEDFSNYSWQTWNQLFPLNARKYATRFLPDGSVDFLATPDHPSPVTPGSVESLLSPGMAKVSPELTFAPGTPLYHLRVRQALRAGATERSVGLTITNHSGAELLSFDFTTEGTDLEPIPLENLANGILPFFPTGKNERVAKTTILLLGTEKVTSLIRREVENGTDYLEAFLSQGLKETTFLMYREWNSPIEHRIFYQYSSSGSDPEDLEKATTTAFEVKKVRKPGDRIGSEYYWIDRQPTGMSSFQTKFNEVLLAPLTKNWQQGFGSLAGFMFLPGFQP